MWRFGYLLRRGRARAVRCPTLSTLAQCGIPHPRKLGVLRPAGAAAAHRGECEDAVTRLAGPAGDPPTRHSPEPLELAQRFCPRYSRYVPLLSDIKVHKLYVSRKTRNSGPLTFVPLRAEFSVLLFGRRRRN